MTDTPRPTAESPDDYAIFDQEPITATGRNLSDHGAWNDDPHGAKLHGAILAIEAEAAALSDSARLDLVMERDMAEAYYKTLEKHLRTHGCDHDFAAVANCEHRPRPEDKPDWDGERCHNCGKGYSTVYRVPDEVWAQLMPDRAPGGLLCLTCADRTALEKSIDIWWSASLGGWAALEAAALSDSARLREALAEYGTHKRGCQPLVIEMRPERPCTCGFTEALLAQSTQDAEPSLDWPIDPDSPAWRSEHAVTAFLQSPEAESRLAAALDEHVGNGFTRPEHYQQTARHILSTLRAKKP